MNCLRVYRGRKNVIDELGDLNSIIKLSSSDMMKNGVFVVIRKLGWSPSRVVLPVHFHFFANPAYSRLPQTCFGLNLMARIALLKKRDNSRGLSSRNRLHVVVEGKKDD